MRCAVFNSFVRLQNLILRETVLEETVTEVDLCQGWTAKNPGGAGLSGSDRGDEPRHLAIKE